MKVEDFELPDGIVMVNYRERMMRGCTRLRLSNRVVNSRTVRVAGEGLSRESVQNKYEHSGQSTTSEAHRSP